jgi:hypothetical protein
MEMKSNRNNPELVSKTMVDKMLREQEEQFQRQLKLQYQYFENMLRQASKDTPESPKFCNEVSKRVKNGHSIKHKDTSHENMYQGFHNYHSNVS